MSEIITHVPTAEELAGANAVPAAPVSEVSEDAINFHDPAQLAEFNEALVANGVAPREAPLATVSPKPAETASSTPTAGSDVEAYVPSELERRVPLSEIRAMAALIMAEDVERK